MSKNYYVDAYILTGGESRRFGSPKCTAVLAGKPLIEWVREHLEPVSKRIFQVGKSPVDPRLPFVRDVYTDQCPLNGIITALEHASTDWVFVIACDMPLVRPELVRHITDHLANRVQALIFSSGGQDHFACGAYHRTALEPLRQQYHRGDYALKRIAGTLNWQRVPVPEQDHWQLLNCNTRAALTKAEKYLQSNA